jgi:hypothetical protein
VPSEVAGVYQGHALGFGCRVCEKSGKGGMGEEKVGVERIEEKEGGRTGVAEGVV